jgi:hypothetical protein
MTLDVPEEPPSPDVSTGLEVRIAIQDVVDADFIDRAAGPAFYTHLRGAEAVVDFRVRALGRAYERYERALGESVHEPQLGGLGLLVLQRTFLMVEDLGGLLYAVTGTDPWRRLTSYSARDLDELFVSILERRQDVAELLLLPTQSELDASPSLRDARVRAAAGKLRDVTLDEVRPLFDFAAAFWMAHREPAKSTLHGFGVVAAEHVLAPPGGGELADIVSMEAPRPFAVALVSREDKAARKVETTHHHLDLTAENVEMVRATGVAAGELYLLAAQCHREALRTKLPWTLPAAYQERLTPDEQRALQAVEGS